MALPPPRIFFAMSLGYYYKIASSYFEEGDQLNYINYW